MTELPDEDKWDYRAANLIGALMAIAYTMLLIWALIALMKAM